MQLGDVELMSTDQLVDLPKAAAEGERIAVAKLTAFCLALLAICSAAGLSISHFERGGKAAGRFLADMSAGVLLCVAWVHLLDDATDTLRGLTEYPAANMSMVVGFLVMAMWQTVAPCVHSHAAHDLAAPIIMHSHGCTSGRKAHQVPLLPQTSAPVSLSHFHTLELAISLHSILIGVGFGFVQSGFMQQLELAIALCVHQFLEGVAVGSLGRQVGLNKCEWAQTYAIFTFSLPLGAVIALASQFFLPFDVNSPGYRWFSGLLGAFAAGTLTHIGCEMLSTQHDHDPHADCRHSDLVSGPYVPPDQPTCPPCNGDMEGPLPPSMARLPSGLPASRAQRLMTRLLATSLGAALLGVLAIWA